jgi:hypothetical protein
MVIFLNGSKLFKSSIVDGSLYGSSLIIFFIILLKVFPVLVLGNLSANNTPSSLDIGPISVLI